MAYTIYPPKPISSGCTGLSPQFEAIASRNPNFVAERKKDGWATVIYILNREIKVYNRHGQILSKEVSNIKSLLLEQGIDNAVLGGELVGPRQKGAIEKMFLYSVYSNSSLLCNRVSLQANKEILKQLIKPNEYLQIVDYYKKEDCPNHSFQDFYKEVIKEPDTEGIILKDLTRPVSFGYDKSPEFPYWIKFKEKGR